MPLPAEGRPSADVMDDLKTRHEIDLPTHGGRIFAYTYDSGLQDLNSLLNEALTTYAAVNGLDPTVFPSIVALENEIIGSAADLLGGGPGGVESVVGVFTSGGTESCVLSVKAARESRPDLAAAGQRAEIVLPETAHPAFRKGAAYFGVDVVTVPVSRDTFKADPAAIAAAITDRTAMVVASAPSYAHGVVDPIEEIAAIAAERGVLCHVDSCIGGWILPYFQRLGQDIPAFDFSLPGVTSISVDLHKYAYASKGASVLLFRDAAVRRGAFFASARWPGYPFVNSTMQSTKSAGPLAAAWAAMQHLGDAGYAELARKTLTATRGLIAGINATPGLRVLGDPLASLVAFTVDADHPASEGIDIYVLADELRLLGWYVQAQPRTGPFPSNIHLTVTAASLPRVEPLLADIGTAMAAAKETGPATPPAELLAFVRALDPSTMSPDELQGLLSVAGFDPAGPGDARLAVVSHLLDALSVDAREELLKEFIGYLYRPQF